MLNPHMRIILRERDTACRHMEENLFRESKR